MDNYLFFMDIINGVKEQIIYIPEYSNFIEFKIISYNKILFVFDIYIFEYKINNNQIDLTEGKLLHILRNGFVYTDNFNIYFYSFLNNSIKVLYNNVKLLDKMIFPDNESMFFIIRDGKNLIINNLR